MIDLGLGSKDFSRRIAEVNTDWDDISSAVLTHTHGDHVCDAMLRALSSRKIPLYCHEGHREALSRFPGFQLLEGWGGVKTFDDQPFLTPHGMRVEPITLSHDGGPTFGFRVEARPTRRSRIVSIGYLADTGCWRRQTAEALMEVDILAVEFNHDVEMQRKSGRAPHLIARNLGPRGHLSNDQGAELVSVVLKESTGHSVRHVVLLHLSEQCNRPELALHCAKTAVKSAGKRAKIHVAGQYAPSPHLPVVGARARRTVPTVFPWEHGAVTDPFRLTADRE